MATYYLLTIEFSQACQRNRKFITCSYLEQDYTNVHTNAFLQLNIVFRFLLGVCIWCLLCLLF